LINNLSKDYGGDTSTINSLIALGKAAVPSLINALKTRKVKVVWYNEYIQKYNDDYYIKGLAAYILGEIGDHKAIPVLIEELNHWYPIYRAYIAEILGNLPDSRSVPALIKALNDYDSEVRKSAVISLGKIGDEKAIPALSDILLNDQNKYVRQASIGSLYQIYRPKSISVLIKAFNDDDDEIRDGAMNVLINIGVPAIPSLIKALEIEGINSLVGVRSSMTLVKIGKPALHDLLLALNNPKLQKEVLWILEQVSPEDAVAYKKRLIWEKVWTYILYFSVVLLMIGIIFGKRIFLKLLIRK